MNILTLLLLLSTPQEDIFPVTGGYSRSAESAVPQQSLVLSEGERAAVPADCYVVVFTADWCSPCQRMKRTTIPALKQRGIRVRTYDINRDAMQSSWRVSTVPATWIVDSATRKPLRKFVGYLTADTILTSLSSRKTQRTQVEIDAENHLRNKHGIETSGLSLLELERIHDADHIRQSGGSSRGWHFPGRASLE